MSERNPGRMRYQEAVGAIQRFLEQAGHRASFEDFTRTVGKPHLRYLGMGRVFDLLGQSGWDITRRRGLGSKFLMFIERKPPESGNPRK